MTTRAAEWGKMWFRFRQSTLSVLGLAIVVVIVGAALLAPYIAPHPRHAGSFVNFEASLKPPSRTYVMGTDDAGRDVLSGHASRSRWAPRSLSCRWSSAFRSASWPATGAVG